MLIVDFIFEVVDTGGKTIVGGHVGIAHERQTRFEVERLVEDLFLKDPGANRLAVHREEHVVLGRRENIDLRTSGCW